MLELFHVLIDPSCSKVRTWVVDHELAEVVHFRNLVYPEHLAALQALAVQVNDGQGETVPALWDGAVLQRGAEACIARLKAELDLGRT